MVVGLGLVVWFWGIQLTLKSIGGDSRGGCINSMSDALPDWGAMYVRNLLTGARFPPQPFM